MKNILLLPSKIVVRLSTILTIILALLINRHRLLFLQYLMAFIHELFHCIGALIFKLNINSITFLPFGFQAEIDNLYNVKWYQELIIIVLGPLSFFISILIIKYLYLNNYISQLLYLEALKTNNFILLFNLLPIYPLDGYRIIKIIFEHFFTEKKCLKIINFISIIFTILLINYTIKNNQIFIISFLIINQVIMLKNLKIIYRKFLISKTSNISNKKIKIHILEDLYRPYNNIIIKNNMIYEDKEYSIFLLKKNK